MFVGHYSVSFLTKRADDSIPLWLLFLAVQWLDVMWAPFILLGIEKARIVPGFTATNPLDLYYMPYTHSLVAALLWSLAAAAAYRAIRHAPASSSLLVGFAVFSHWILDFIVHTPDLPLYDDSMKVGLGLWNHPVLASGLEVLLLFGAMVLYLQRNPKNRTGIIIFGVAMLGIQAYVFFGPPPVSPAAAAATALGAYVIFALVIWWLADREPAARTA
jgi:membrane-bound metal-dependent hydrolase YbcI (DUF457 family)